MGRKATVGPTVLYADRDSSRRYLETIAVLELPTLPFSEWFSLAFGWGSPRT